MSKKRLYEIAKELGKESKEVVARAKELGLEVKNHASSVEAAAAEKIVASFKPATPKQKQQPLRLKHGFSLPSPALLHALQLPYFLFQVLLRFRTIFS